MSTPDTVYVTYIVAPPQMIWDALTSPDLSRQYFYGRLVDCDWKVGSRITYRRPDGRPDVEGEILEADKPKLLSMTWRVVGSEELRKLPQARVSFRIDSLGPVVRLTLTESRAGVVPEKFVEGGRRGWPVIINGLKTLIETGSPMPKFKLEG